MSPPFEFAWNNPRLAIGLAFVSTLGARPGGLCGLASSGLRPGADAEEIGLRRFDDGPEACRPATGPIRNGRFETE
jgi:hypothetical protein